MAMLIEAALRSSVILAGALAVSAGLGRRSAARRHATLAAGILASALVVPLTMVVPGWDVPRLAIVAAPAASAPAVSADAIAASVSPDAPLRPAAASVIPRIWAAGVALGLAIAVAGMARLVRLTRRSSSVADGVWRVAADEIAAVHGVRQPIALVRTASRGVVATWGFRRPIVLLPEEALEWSDAWVRAALHHEIAHIRRWDWPIQVAAMLVRTVFWFNPLCWIACARLRRESEHACDDRVLAAGLAPAVYADHLVNIARTCRTLAWMPAMSMARSSTLERRVAAMLNDTRDRRTLTRRAVLVLLALMAVMTMAVASLDLSAQAGVNPLAGQIYDMTGGTLPGVTVTLEDERQLQWSEVTDGLGRFRFPPVQTGRYVLRASLPGFKPLQDEFQLERPRDWTRVITLQLGEIEETVTVTASRAPAVPAQPDEFRPVRVGGNIRPPAKLVDVHPVYPESMRGAGLDGAVPMEALIGIDGRVTSVRVLSAQVHPEFAQAAETAVRQWVFSPTRLNGRPVEVRMVATIRFGLLD